MQDDESLKYDTANYLARADLVAADWIRLIVYDSHWNAGETDAYVLAAAAAKAHGKRVMVSLAFWHSHPTPAEARVFAERVYARMAPVVDAWSPMNEPNWPGMAPHMNVQCVETSSPSAMATRKSGRRIRGWKKVRRGRGTHQRHVKRRHRRKVIRFTRAHTRKQQRRAQWKRASHRAWPKAIYVTSMQARRECTAEAMGVAYGRVWDRVAPVLAQGGALMVGGDLCPARCRSSWTRGCATGCPPSARTSSATITTRRPRPASSSPTPDPADWCRGSLSGASADTEDGATTPRPTNGCQRFTRSTGRVLRSR
jgi:hypothetical protein